MSEHLSDTPPRPVRRLSPVDELPPPPRPSTSEAPKPVMPPVLPDYGEIPPVPSRAPKREPQPPFTPDFDRDPVSRQVIDAKRPIGEMVSVGNARLDEAMAALDAQQKSMGSGAVHGAEYMSLTVQKRELAEAKKLLADRMAYLSEHASAGQLASEIRSQVDQLGDELRKKHEKLAEVKPSSAHIAARRIMGDGLTAYERPLVDAAQKDVDEYTHHLKIAKLLQDHLPHATVPTQAA